MDDFDRKNRSAVMNILTHRYGIPEFDAEDILQDAWLLLMEKLTVGELPDVPEKLLAYITCVCTNKAHEWLRKREYNNVSFDDDSLTAERLAQMEQEVQAWADYLDEQARARQRMIEVMYAEVDHLNPRHRALLLGFYMENQSMRELARRLGYSSEEVARNTRVRIIKSLRTGIQQQGGADGNGLTPAAFLSAPPCCMSPQARLIRTACRRA